MSAKLTINLPKPVAASDNCLPHAAMALGSIRGNTTRPQSAMVARLVIQEQPGGWVMHRLDGQGGFIGDSAHPTKEDALREARREFGIGS